MQNRQRRDIFGIQKIIGLGLIRGWRTARTDIFRRVCSPHSHFNPQIRWKTTATSRENPSIRDKYQYSFFN